MSFIVYCHTSLITGKRYIGWTSLTMEQRWEQHLYAADHDSMLHFHRAIRLHGRDTWLHEVLETCETRVDACERAEPFWIEKLDTFGSRGYNMTPGGDGFHGIMSEQAKQNMSRAQKGRKKSLAHREKIRQFMLSDKHPHRGKALSAETRKKIRDGSNCIAVEQLDLDGNIIATFPSIQEAADQTRCPDKTKIGLCCRGKRKTAYGFAWRYSK